MTAQVDGSVGQDGESDRLQSGRETAHVVEFHLGRNHCAIDVEAVEGIEEMKQVTRVPRAPDPVDGVVDLRGETTAVVDPRRVLEVEEGGGEQSILVLDRGADTQKVGFRVDDVTEVQTYGPAQIDHDGERTAFQSGALEDDLVRGVIRKPQKGADEEGESEAVRLVLWLDIEAMMTRVAGEETDPLMDPPSGDIHA